jgi:CheY-like chemotaxis protein
MANLCTLSYEHPTTIVLVDDDEGFLKSFSLALHREGTIKTFSSPAAAVQEINAQGEALAGYLPSQGLPRLSDPGRFELFSVLVTDYEMDAMNGVELCQCISGSPVGRILLTGKVDERYAVRAFNDDIIDRYVRKDDPEMVDLVKRYIQDLKREFFQRALASSGEKQVEERTRLLCDPVVSEFFQRSRQENGVIEYYLSNLFPGFLMLDAEGDMLAFAVLTEGQLAEHIEAAENANAPKQLLELLRAGVVIPFFPSERGRYAPEFSDTWKNWVFTANTIEGNKRYYHAVVSGPAAHAGFMNWPVFPYNQYLREQEA